MVGILGYPVSVIIGVLLGISVSVFGPWGNLPVAVDAVLVLVAVVLVNVVWWAIQRFFLSDSEPEGAEE